MALTAPPLLPGGLGPSPGRAVWGRGGATGRPPHTWVAGPQRVRGETAPPSVAGPEAPAPGPLRSRVGQGSRREAILLGGLGLGLGWAALPAPVGATPSTGTPAGSAGSLPPPDRRPVFVAGASGRTGRLVVEELARRGIPVRAGVRTASGAREAGLLERPSLVTVVEFDLTAPEASLAAAIGDSAAVVCATGFVPTFVPGDDRGLARAVDNVGARRLVDAAVSAGGVEHFVLLSSLLVGLPTGAPGRANYDALNLLGGVLDEKAVSEAHLRASGLRWTVVRAGVFASRRQGGVVLGREGDLVGDPRGDVDTRGPGGSRRYKSTPETRRCQQAFLSSGGNVCGATRAQVAEVVAAAVASGPARRPGRGPWAGEGQVIEVAARPDGEATAESTWDAWGSVVGALSS